MSTKIQPTTTGYLTPKARGRLVTKNGYHGVFAKTRIFTGELIAVWGGDILGSALVYAMPPEQKRLALQVDEDLYLVSSKEGPADWINHCCTPNAGMSGQISLVALRDILPGEEVCFDYAMTDGSPYDEFECRCGAANCRGRVTGEDWRRWELQGAYQEFFSPYLKRRIQDVALREAGLSSTGLSNAALSSAGLSNAALSSTGLSSKGSLSLERPRSARQSRKRRVSSSQAG